MTAQRAARRAVTVLDVGGEPRPQASKATSCTTPTTRAEGAVALEESYQDESYDYGNYEEGYDDGSGGMIDPNTGMPLAAGADGN